MKAVILAAGLGRRLRGASDGRPKALLAVDPHGRTILARLLDQCAACGIREVLVVTGYEEGAIRAHLDDAPLPVGTVHNPAFATTNNAHSLLLARPFVGAGPFVKFDGDLVLHDALLPRLLASPQGSHLLLDDVRPLTEEDMKARLDGPGGRVTALDKGLPYDGSGPEAAAGVSIGAERIDEADVGLVFDALETTVHERGHTDAYYEDAYQAAFADGFILRATSTGGLPWAEIDTPEDLAAARETMLPARAVRGAAR